MLPEIRLTTDRLTLRTPVEADFEAVAAFMPSARMQFLGGPVSDAGQQWRGFAATAGHWALKGYGYFTVLHDDRPVGRVGLINPPLWDEPELGWHLFDGCEGQGYATEAARAVRAWGFHERGLGPVISYIDPANTPSQQVARRLGAKVERQGEVMGTPCEVWRHPSEEAV